MLTDASPEQLNDYTSQLRGLLENLNNDSWDESSATRIGDDSAVKANGSQDQLIGLLLTIEAVYASNILSNLLDAESQMVDCFMRVVNPTLTAYRKFLADERSIYYTQWQEQFSKLCKHFAMFIKELLKRLVQVFGTTRRLSSVLESVGLGLLEQDQAILEADEAKPQNVQFLDRLFGQGLCKLGDLSRYRSLAKKSPDYKHALAYYRSCVLVWKSDGTPWNQMGIVHYSRGEYGDAYYYFNKSLCTEHPFKDSNIQSVLKRFVRASLEEIRVNDVADKDAKLALASVTKRIAEYDFLHMNSKSMRSQPLDKADEYNEIQGLVQPLLYHIESAHISYKPLVRLAILAAMVNWRLSQEKGVNEYKNGLFDLTMVLIQGLSSMILKLCGQVGGQGIISNLLPCVRVLFDWLAKDFDEYVSSRDVHAANCLREVVQLLEWIRQTQGFMFDALTAVATQSGRGSPLALYEEIECFECSALWDSLNDTPSGIDLELAKADDPILFRYQCILFSGVRIASERDTFVDFDTVGLKFGFSGPKKSLATSDESSSLEFSVSELTFSDITTDVNDDDEDIVFKPRVKG